jgi:chemotaxis protein methyltransferase CheR
MSPAGAELAVKTPGATSPRPLRNSDFAQLRRLVYREAGIHLSLHKQALVESRLGGRLRQLGLRSYRDYVLLVQEDAEERIQMLDRITTNETRFFREPHQFRFLEERLFPHWQAEAARGARRRSVRVWSAGCSTGEEPYSLAMSLLHHFPPASGWSLEVHATDLSTRALDAAFTGVYPVERSSEIPRSLLRRFVRRGTGAQEGSMRVVSQVRALVTFQRLNINQPSQVPGPFDLVLCRNVLIYFDTASRRRAIEALVRQLVPGGHFLLGHSESLNGANTELRHVVPNVYLKPAPGGSSVRCA